MMVRVESEDGVYIRIQSISEVCVDEKGRYSHMNRLYLWEFDPENPGVGQYYAPGNLISRELGLRLNRFGVKQSEIERVNQLLLDKHKSTPSLLEERPKPTVVEEDGIYYNDAPEEEAFNLEDEEYDNI